MIKSASGGIFTYATADRKRSPTDGFDIGASDDACLGIPTSIKTSSGNIVSLSDARAFWASFNHVPYRMLVGSYDQKGDRKFFREIHEILFRDIYKRRILGDVSIGQVTGFHEGLKGFGVGDHERARSWARDRKMEIGKSGLVKLNPKVDSKSQRRLQCSINLSSLIEILDQSDYKLHTDTFGALPLPIRILSVPRDHR